jgi:hypothetical protein
MSDLDTRLAAMIIRQHDATNHGGNLIGTGRGGSQAEHGPLDERMTSFEENSEYSIYGVNVFSHGGHMNPMKHLAWLALGLCGRCGRPKGKDGCEWCKTRDRERRKRVSRQFADCPRRMKSK